MAISNREARLEAGMRVIKAGQMILDDVLRIHTPSSFAAPNHWILKSPSSVMPSMKLPTLGGVLDSGNLVGTPPNAAWSSWPASITVCSSPRCGFDTDASRVPAFRLEGSIPRFSRRSPTVVCSLQDSASNGNRCLDPSDSVWWADMTPCVTLWLII